MNFWVFPLFILGMAFSATASGTDSPVFQYEDAIEISSKIFGTDRRKSFERCTQGWSENTRQRTHLFWLARNWKYLSDDPIVFVEIGNSGFSRYDFIYLKGDILVSSLGPEKKLSESLKNSVGFFLKSAGHDSEGSSSLGSYDDDCFFVTAIDRGTSTSFAVYGLPDSTIGRFLKKILGEAR